MSMERTRNIVTFTCEACPTHETFDTNVTGFAGAFKELKRKGWRVAAGRTGVFCHLCPRHVDLDLGTLKK